MATNFDRNQHLGDDASARQMANALDALAAADLAGAPAGLSERIAKASMPQRTANGLRLAGTASRPWAVRLRPMLALAAVVAVVVAAGIYMNARGLNGRGASVPEPIATNDTPAPVVPTVDPNAATTEVVPQLAIAKASSDVETWLAVGLEMDSMLSSAAADLSATASDLEERATTSFAADNWYSDASL